MQGINRLGKAPPRPGSLRPPDPNKYKTENMYSLGGENDAEYLRMVQDVRACCCLFTPGYPADADTGSCRSRTRRPITQAGCLDAEVSTQSCA